MSVYNGKVPLTFFSDISLAIISDSLDSFRNYFAIDALNLLLNESNNKPFNLSLVFEEVKSLPFCSTHESQRHALFVYFTPFNLFL